MTYRLAAAVHLKDPDTHETVILAEGTTPEARLAALVTNPAAWVGGKVPPQPKAATQEPDGGKGTGEGPGNGDGSVPPPAPDPVSDPDPAPQAETLPEAEPAPRPEPAEDTKTPAKKAASSRPSRRGAAAAEGTGGQ